MKDCARSLLPHEQHLKLSVSISNFMCHGNILEKYLFIKLLSFIIENLLLGGRVIKF